MADPKPLPGTNDAQTRRRKRRDSDVRGNDAGNGGGDSAGDAAEAKLNKILEQFGGGGFRLLAERTDSAGANEYLGAINFNSELYESVRQRWGGGLYGGRIVDASGKYQARFPQFRIAGAPRIPNDVQTPQPPAPATGLEQILQSINANLAALATAQRGPVADPIDQFTKFARALREASATNGAAAAPVEPLGMMRDMLGLMRELREDTAPPVSENNFGVVLREGVQPLVQVLNRKLDIDADRERRRANPKALPAGQHAAPAVPAPSVPVNEELVEVPSDELAALLLTIPVPARRFLLSCAENDDEPEDYVGMLLNRLSDDAYDAMARLLPREDFLNVLVETIPAYAEYRQWFGRLVDALREAVSADSVVAGEPGQVAPAAQGIDA